MTNYNFDNRTVMTLDAGGTNFVFSAIRGCKEIIEPIRLPSIVDDADKSLELIAEGFRQVKEKLAEAPVAISFAFPGPADYVNGVLGDLPNFPGFRGGVALGPYLEEVFGIPVFINNDGNLFAYGEAIAGLLPEVNAKLSKAGIKKTYKNLIGLTFGTGYGCGVVIDGTLLRGDNGCGGDVWLMRNCFDGNYLLEENVSIRGIKYMYGYFSGNPDHALSPKDICDVIEGRREGDKQAALKTFEYFGKAAAEGVINALDMIDGLIVIGGGISYNYKYILPAMIEATRAKLSNKNGEKFPILQMEVFNLMDEDDSAAFYKDECREADILGTSRKTIYNFSKKTGIAISKLGASKAISIGAYAFALSEIDKYEAKVL